MKVLYPTYDQMIQKSYAYSAEEQLKYNWILIKLLYENNYINDLSENVSIPKRIHQIWLGSDLPKEYVKYTESWKKFHPTWEYKLWTDYDLKDIEIVHRDIFNNAKNLGMRSDILRYEILRQFGGLYVDTDFECLKPFDDLMYLDLFTGIGYDSKLQLYIGLIASKPESSIMSYCAYYLHDYYTGDRGSYIMNATGANYFTNCFFKGVNSLSKKIVAFPPDFFYPFPNNMRRDENINPYDFVTETSYAIHHWAVSWIKSKK